METRWVLQVNGRLGHGSQRSGQTRQQSLLRVSHNSNDLVLQPKVGVMVPGVAVVEREGSEDVSRPSL